MTTELVTATRAEEFFRHHDAKDLAYLRATFADDAQGVDEISRGWFRGRKAVEAYLAEVFPKIEEMHSIIEGHAVSRYVDVEVETFLLRQHYLFAGTPHEIEAPTTIVWHRQEGSWRVVLVHSIPLAATA